METGLHHSFSILDALVILIYLGGTTALGVILGRNQKDTRDYFVAGNRIPWWGAMISIVGTETSALTFISIPGLAYLANLSFLQVAAGYILGRIVVAFVLLPKYFEGQLVTAYALYERRFGVNARRFSSVIFLVTRALADSVRVFATAIPVALIIGPAVPASLLMPVSILSLGVLSLIYSYYGGVRAVIWTDVLQTSVYLLGGIAAVVVLGNHVGGGWETIFAQSAATGKLQVFDFYTGFDRPHTILAGLLGGAFLSMASHGADQTIVQRLLAVGSLRDAQRALIGSGIAVFLQFVLFLIIGLGLYEFFSGEAFGSPDAIFPTFIITAMPNGLVGLLIAAILAATMSSHAGAINSLASSTMHDIYLPAVAKRKGVSIEELDSNRILRISRICSLMWGVLLLVMALLFKQNGTPIVVIALSIASFTYGSLLGGFFLGIISRRANERDAITGMAIALVVMCAIVFSRMLSPYLPFLSGISSIAWPWYVMIGTTVTVVVGMLSSLVTQKR